MPSAKNKIRWGVLGYARIARESVIPAMVRSYNAEFSALASREPGKLAESRTRFGHAHRLHGSYEALLADPNIDAVYIPLPNSLHHEWTLTAAAAGKHVLCEKPLALNAAQCRGMIAAAAQHKVLLMEAFMYRFTGRTAQVVDLVRSGVLGELRFVQSSFRFLLNNPASIKLRPELGGGALYDVGCYPINFIGMIADLLEGGTAKARPVSLSTECVREGGVDMIFSANLRYASGLIGSLHTGLNAHKRVHSEIIGTKGILEIPDTFFDNPAPMTLRLGEDVQEIPVEPCARYVLEVESFSNSLLNGQPAAFSLDETLRNAEVLDALMEDSLRK